MTPHWPKRSRSWWNRGFPGWMRSKRSPASGGCQNARSTSDSTSSSRGWPAGWRRAAIRAANVLTGTVFSNSAWLALVHLLEDQLAYHQQELGVNADGCSANHVQAPLFSDGSGLRIQVVKHLHMIGNESDRYDYDRSARFQFTQNITDVGLEPRLAWRTTVTLIHQLPVSRSQTFRNQPAGFVELLLVVARLGHRDGNAVGGKDDMRIQAVTRRHLIEGGAHSIHFGFNKRRMVVKRPQFLDLRRAFTGLGPRPLDVFQVLPAAGIGTEYRGDEGQRPSYAVSAHLTQCIDEIRMPVSITPIDRQPPPLAHEQCFQSGNQRPI